MNTILRIKVIMLFLHMSYSELIFYCGILTILNDIEKYVYIESKVNYFSTNGILASPIHSSVSYILVVPFVISVTRTVLSESPGIQKFTHF